MLAEPTTIPWISGNGPELYGSARIPRLQGPTKFLKINHLSGHLAQRASEFARHFVPRPLLAPRLPGGWGRGHRPPGPGPGF